MCMKAVADVHMMFCRTEYVQQQFLHTVSLAAGCSHVPLNSF
jgi:hypothetical protein